MKFLFFPAIIAASFLANGCHAESPKVFAHYMPWFEAEKKASGEFAWSHWQWYGKGPKHDPDDVLPNGRRDIASVFYPLIGPYDERDPAVLEYQILTAKAAGIDGFIADWYGPGNSTDKMFAGLVKAAERYGFTVAICLEEKSFFPSYSQAKTRTEVEDVMRRQIEYALSQYASSTSYARSDGLPVFLIFSGYGEGELGPNTLSREELGRVFDNFKDQKFLLVRSTLDRLPAGAAKACYIWSANWDSREGRESYYRATQTARAHGEVQYWMGGCSPGFDDTGVWGWGQGPRVLNRRGTATYEEQWNEVLRYHPDAVQIITWNDLEEGTTIEPTEEYGFRFVDLTERYVEKYTGRRANLEDNQWPLRIYKLRRAVSSIQDAATREDYTRRLDRLASAFARGRRFLMGWDLNRLEQTISNSNGGATK
jgi:hypothetical protein